MKFSLFGKIRCPRARGLSFLASAALVGTLTTAPASMPASAAVEKALNPCSFVSNDDVLHLLGWTVEGREPKPYDLHGGTGTMCFISSTQGQVVVIVPDLGSD